MLLVLDIAVIRTIGSVSMVVAERATSSINMFDRVRECVKFILCATPIPPASVFAKKG